MGKIEPYDLAVKTIQKRLATEWDIVISICGEEGVGKSHLAIQLGADISKKDITRFLDENVVYSSSVREFYEKFDRLEPKQSIVIDEAIHFAYKRFWNSGEQASFNQYLTTIRKRQKCIIMNMPLFDDFDVYFRNHRIKIWIEVIRRGVAVMFAADKFAGTDDPWNLHFNRKQFRKFTNYKRVGDRLIDDELNAYRRYANYLMTFQFPPLAEDMKEKYLMNCAEIPGKYARLEYISD